MNKKEDFGLEEYDGKHHDLDEDYDEEEQQEEIDYEKFNKTNDFDVDEDYDNGEEWTLERNQEIIDEDSMNKIMTFLTWFGRVGIVIALILIAYYISHGNIKGLILYLLLLVASYFGGYFLMYFIDKVRNPS